MKIQEIKNPEGQMTFSVETDTVVCITDLDTGSRDAVIDFRMSNPGTKLEVQGRALANDQNKKKWKIIIHHESDGNISNLDLRGIATEKGFLRFEGGGVLELSSTDGEMNISEKIHLFDSAKGQCLPILTVKTDQVVAASHSASVSPIDAESLLFLSARGIDNETAKKLIKNGFLGIESGEPV